MQTLTIRSTFPSLNEVIDVSKRHWSQYAKLKKELTLSVAVQAMGAGLKPVKRPVEVKFFWYEKNRRKDVDNIAHGAKYILDGLVEGYILQNDTQAYVAQIGHVFDVDKANPRVEVEIQEIEG